MKSEEVVSPDLLTIVVPVKNEERNLPGCLENVKRSSML